MRRIPLFSLLTLVLLFSACSAPREAGRDGTTTGTTRTDEPRRPVTRTVQGFRIQLLTTPEKATAEQTAERARDWWQGLPASQRPAYLGGGELDVDVKWKQPYYRVHVGAFASRAEAERALDTVARTFPDAFLVPETVTITR